MTKKLDLTMECAFSPRGDANSRYAYAKLGRETDDGRELSCISRVRVHDGELFAHANDGVYTYNSDTGKWRRCAE